MSIEQWLVTLAIAVVVALSLYCLHLWRKVFRQRKERADAETQRLKEQQEKREHWEESVRLIARAALAGQANITECAIRIKVLLDGLTQNACPREPYRPIYELAWATAHMPILDQRKQYKRSEIMAFDREREAFEEELGEAVKEAMRQLLDDDFYSA
ncbi:conserved hypothetical protein [gamma proteobacterium HTCC5015]|nr:conserved hypothetical protein [gamma proteobacterium HTCC5015]